MSLLVAAYTALKSAKILVPIAAGVIAFGTGVVAAQAWDHHAPWGLEAKRVKAVKELGEVRRQRDTWQEASDIWEVKYRSWNGYALKVLEPQLRECNNAAAGQVTAGSEARSAASARAFDNGYAAGRSAGVRSCGAPDANSVRPADVGRLGGVQRQSETLSESWGARAYRPPAPVRPNH